METHQFRVVAWWSSGRYGMAKADSAPNVVHFTAPPGFGGLDGRWTPEDMLLGAVASCFTTTFRALAEHSKFEYTDLEVEAEAIVSKAERGYTIGEIALRPRLTVGSEEHREQACQLLNKTKTLCLVSRALAVAPTLEVRIEVGKALPVG